MKKLLLLSILSVSFGCLARASSDDCEFHPIVSAEFLSAFDAFLRQNNLGTKHNFVDKLFDLRNLDLKNLKNFFKSKGVDYNTWVNNCALYFDSGNPVCKKMTFDDFNNWATANSQYYKNYRYLVWFIFSLDTPNNQPPAAFNDAVSIFSSNYPAAALLLDAYGQSALDLTQFAVSVNCAKIRP